jgi:hypothetical protein
MLEARDLPSFLAPVSYDLGAAGQEAVVSDFNGDGNKDVAVTLNTGPFRKLAVKLGDGTGRLGAPVFYNSSGANGLATGDVNGDGRPDLVTVAGSWVFAYLGNGDGTFQAPLKSPSGGTSEGDISLGDVNGDHVPDVATANTADQDSVSVLLGKGDGTFQAPTVYPLGQEGPMVTRIGDLDGDGRGDVTVDTYYSSKLHVFYGNGNQQTYNLEVPHGHVLADVNRDGHLDVVGGQYSSHIGVLLNRGDGTLQKAVYYPGPTYSLFPETGDLNRDGKVDLAMANGGFGTVGWVLGNGDSSFQAPGTAFIGETGWWHPRIAVGDLTHDGYDDLVVPGQTGLIVLINDAHWPVKALALPRTPDSAGGLTGPGGDLPPATAAPPPLSATAGEPPATERRANADPGGNGSGAVRRAGQARRPVPALRSVPQFAPPWSEVGTRLSQGPDATDS